MQAVKIVGNRNALEIHHDAVEVAMVLKSNYLRLFEILLEVESQRIYFDFDVPSLYVYCTELLELPKQTAKDFICVVRKSFEVPELAIAIHCSCRVVEKTVAMANPKAAVEESLRYVSGDALELKLGVSEEWVELLAATKDVMSQKERRAVSSEESLFALMSEFLRKNDPVEKAKRAEKRATAKSVEAKVAKSIVSTGAPKTRYRPMSVEHRVDLRDGGQCAFVDANGKRCESRRWLEKHHIVEFANGGQHSVDNLITYCSAHHKIRHLQIAKGKGVT